MSRHHFEFFDLLLWRSAKKRIRVACSAGVFWTGESCLFMFLLFNRHLCYDGGRLGKVKIVTLRVGAGAKEGRGRGEKNTPARFFWETLYAGKRSP